MVARCFRQQIMQINSIQEWHQQCEILLKHQTNVCKPTTFAVRGGNKKDMKLNETVVKKETRTEVQPVDTGTTLEDHASVHQVENREKWWRTESQMCSLSTDESWQDTWALTGPLPHRSARTHSYIPFQPGGNVLHVQKHQDPSLMTPPLFFTSRSRPIIVHQSHLTGW